MIKPVVELRNVDKHYQLGEVDLHVLKNINLKIQRGEFVSITGPSGSGKSTMLNMIGALDRPTKGKVLIDGKDVSKMDDNELAMVRGKKIGFVFQTFNLIPRFTAVENVMFPMWFAGKDNKEERAIELLKKVGLGHRLNNRPSQMSGGERQRVAIARALANNPELIVADEPTGNLDSKTGKEIINILCELNKEGKTLIIVTHEKSIASIAKRKVELLDGRIVRDRK